MKRGTANQAIKDGDAPCRECGRKSSKYNGWTNYETWCVALWLDNDQGLQEYWQERAADALKRARPCYSGQSEEEAAAHELSSELQDEVKDGELRPELGATMYSDLLGAALSEVNWYEIATTMIDNAREEAC